MLLLLIPSRYRPIALMVIGAAALIVGIVVSSRLAVVIGGAFVVYGAIRGVSRLTRRRDDEDRYPSR